jgi:hypothetical protein
MGRFKVIFGPGLPMARPEPNVQFFFIVQFSQIAPIILPKLPIILKYSR